MGAFNRVAGPPEPCPRCGNIVRRPVQFKFGVCRQIDYEIGESIEIADADDSGEVVAHVIVDGAPEPCPVCGYESPGEEVFAVEIRTAVIVDVWRAEKPLATKLLQDGCIAI